MNLAEELSLIFLGLTLGAQILHRRSFWFWRKDTDTGRREIQSQKFSLVTKIVFWGSVATIFGVLIYWSIIQYDLWAGNELTKTLLPPYQSFTFFYSYVGKRFFAPWLVSLLGAIFIGGLAHRLNNRFGNRFFEEGETKLLSLGVFLSGYPGFLIYLVLVFGAGFMGTIIFQLSSKGRFPFYYFWLPLAIVAIIITVWVFPRFGLTPIIKAFYF